jgi:hypothetical protein
MHDRTDNFSDKLLAEAEARRRKGFVILAFANHAYKEVLLNWLVAMHRIKIDNYIIVSLDQELHDFLSQRDIPSVLSPLQGGLDQLWVKRIEIFRMLIDHEIAFLHSDIDAIWLRNPIPDYFSSPGYDLMFSQGTIHPSDVVRKRGFVFCCGLFYMQSSDTTKRILSEMERDVRETGDDQITVNRVIENYGLDWNIDRAFTYSLNFRDTTFICSTQPITGESVTSPLRVCLLPHHAFQRMHMPDKDAYVKHLLSRKKAERKLDMFRATDCLFLRPDWRSVEFSSDTMGLLSLESAA